MNAQEALAIVNQVLSPQSLSQIQELVFHHSWNQKTYKEIAVDVGYDSDYVKEIGSELWKMLSNSLGQRVTKKNVQIILGEQSSLLSAPAIANQPSFPLLGAPLSVADSTTASPQHIFDWHYFENYLDQEWQLLLTDAVLLSELIPALTCLSLILCDVDGLQVARDFDPETNHLYLQQVANTLEQHLKRPKDLLAYYPAGKFGILLPQTQARGAVHLAETMRMATKQLGICQPNSSDSVTVSLGVTTTSPNAQSTPNDLLMTGMQALQQAQQRGGDQVIYKPV